MVISSISTEIVASRSDPIYMAHGYLTKVPVAAITPFIEAFTERGALVADPFAGSGMTGVAATICGRRAALSDISKLGQHIGLNYVNLVDSAALTEVSQSVIATAREWVPGLYDATCSHCGTDAEIVKAIWSKRFECPACDTAFTYYAALREGEWKQARCPGCGADVQPRRLRHVGEALVREFIRCDAHRKQVEQDPQNGEAPRFPDKECWPDVPIPPDFEMYRRSALGKHRLTTTASFFSQRNLTALAALRDAINEVQDAAIRGKLLFAFTSILPRSSKRYQWSRKRPLNAQNQTYYVSSVFYEWNVFDLFTRKVGAAIASDNAIRRYGPLFTPSIDVSYALTSADDLNHLEADSVDYVFTDPPFGSNIFYSDMNLFQEAWLNGYTDRSREAVIDTSKDTAASAARYEEIIGGALRECHRVLKPGAWCSMVFSSSRGDVWAMAHRALKASGLELVPEHLSSIDKGQRSVKGLASGWEAVVTSDLVFTARKPVSGYVAPAIRAPGEPIEESVDSVLTSDDPYLTPSRVYLGVVRRYIERHWDLEDLHLDDVLYALSSLGFESDRRSGVLRRS